MHKFYIHSPQVRIVDHHARPIQTVAVYDDSLLYDYLIGAKLVCRDGHAVERVKSAIYHFLSHWQDGERRIQVSFGQFIMACYPTNFIEPEYGMVTLGVKPVDPEQEVLAAMRKFTASVQNKSPNAAKIYQELQDTLKKYPTIEIKA